jgi:hypothetical protein
LDRIAYAAVFVLLFACGDDGSSANNNDGSRGSDCIDSSDCNDGLVCTDELECGDGAECVNNIECERGSICNAQGVCETNVPGGSCVNSPNCVTGEICDDGTCFAVGPNGCIAPDLLIVLDRTGSMAERPDESVPPNNAQGISETKWALAINSVEAVTSSLQDGIRFGLAMFPRDADDPGGQGDCSAIGTWLAASSGTGISVPDESDNPSCETPGDREVTPLLNNAPAIDAALDIDNGGLCISTPIDAGLLAAEAELADVKDPDRLQFALLITDGADNCDAQDAINTAKSMSASEVNTYVVGFDGSGGGVDEGQLNALACAGGTAPNFMQNCEPDGSGGFNVVGNRPDDRLFLLAESAQGLEQALTDIGSDICCNCGSID